MLSIRFRSFFLGIITTSIVWSIMMYLYLNLSTPVLHRRRLIPRVYSKETNFLRLQDDNKILQNERSEFNMINDDPLFDEWLVKKQKHFNETDPLMMGVIREPADQKVKDEGYHRHAFNLLISNRLGYHRNIPDTRNPLCQQKIYDSKLPKASIIICFYNEALSTLLRTVHTVLDRSPELFLEEIILVDDYSETSLMKSLTEYIDRNLSDKVKLRRTPERAGLIRARTFGARQAVGEVLIFLDSHCEVNVGWIEPLLQRIHEDRTVAVCPIIDIINADTFQYSASPIVKGGFNWGLHFKWDTVQSETLQKKSNLVQPIRSPTMAGGLFAINRLFFHNVGEYDEGMDIWGGENLEISFRLWTCGGSLEIIPCSRVGHVFRHRRPYGAPDGEDTLTRNSLRVAHVWMDEYKEYYFQIRPDIKYQSYGNIDSRLALRKRLKCKSFDWYLKNVYPDLKLPKKKDQKVVYESKDKPVFNFQRTPVEVVAKYQLSLSGTSLCIESEDEVTTKGSLLILRVCRNIKKQIWHETEKNDLRLAHLLCLDAGERYPRLYKCHEMGGMQDWRHTANEDTAFYNPAAGLCLGVAKKQVGEHIILVMCSSPQAQKWDLKQH